MDFFWRLREMIERVSVDEKHKWSVDYVRINSHENSDTNVCDFTDTFYLNYLSRNFRALTLNVDVQPTMFYTVVIGYKQIIVDFFF